VDDLPEGYRVYLVSEAFRSSEYAFRFFNRGVKIVDVDARNLAAAASDTGPAVYILVGENPPVATLTRLHPDAEVETHLDGDNRPVFVSVTVDG
jgi:hypothetical protein